MRFAVVASLMSIAAAGTGADCTKREYNHFPVSEIITKCTEQYDAKYIGDCIDPLVHWEVSEVCFNCAVETLRALNTYPGQCRGSCAAGDIERCSECTGYVGFALAVDCAQVALDE